MKVLVHILTYNSEEWIVPCIESVLAQDYPAALFITDNSSQDNTIKRIEDNFSEKVKLFKNRENLGFAAGQNQAATLFLKSDADLLLLINPDVILQKNFISEMVAAFKKNPTTGIACGKLLRKNDQAIFDCTGIIFTKSLRHFDRGSEELDTGQYEVEELVVGASGACVAFTKKFINSVSFRAERDQDSAKIYPQLKLEIEDRTQLFDEAFFAYREDADLAWRSAALGWRCLYVPKAVASHVRRVTPERREELPPEINTWSVRNRYLMQVNNFRWYVDRPALLPGLIIRNLVVFLGVILKGRSSLAAFKQFLVLLPRALERRKWLKIQSKGKVQYELF